MISFDNGPADGDYVRYIETMARNAATDVAAAAARDDVGSSLARSNAAGATGFDDAAQARMRQIAMRRAAGATDGPAPRSVVRDGGSLVALARALAVTVAGAVLVVVGAAMEPTRIPVVVAGLAIGVLGIRRASTAVDAMRRTGAAP